MRRQGCQIGILLVICGLLWWSAGEVQAQKTDTALQEQHDALQFPTSEEEIIKLLGIKPPDDIVKPRGGLQSSGNDGSLFGGATRGLGSIADDNDIDEEALQSAPKVGALILFDFDSTNIRDESRPLLEQFANAFQRPELENAIFVIAGHTDSKGSERYNFHLSEERAKAVRQYLSQIYHLPEERFVVKAYGEIRPVATNETDEGRAINRRVEFIRVQ